MAGYSQRSLVDKLGIEAGARAFILGAPPGYDKTLGALPPNVTLAVAPDGPLDFIHLFTKRHAELEQRLPALRQAMAQNGMLWVSWPKGASKVPTDLNENIVREVALRNGLVDVKVAAVDETWSGLKLAIRVKDRK